VKTGDLVRNVRAVYEQAMALGDRHLGQTIEPGCVGIVLDVRGGEHGRGLAMNYVDVMFSVDGTSVRCGNYGQGHFEVIA
jgi:hypothetical protein